jgi:hypothetical protein
MQISLFFLSALVSLSMASRTPVRRADGCTADDDCADGTYCFFDTASKLITLKSLLRFPSGHLATACRPFCQSSADNAGNCLALPGSS